MNIEFRAIVVSFGLWCCAGTFAAPLGSNEAHAQTTAAEWTQIRPAGETGCALQTDFSFFYRQGADPSRLLIYFEGGGACWEWVSCSGMFDTNVSDDELAPFAGVFDFANPANPLRDYSVIFIPYCTGDVHVGDTIQHYGNAPARVPVAHFGYRNVDAVFRWMAANMSSRPASIVISGTSAGSYGALFYAPRVAREYPAAKLTLIGDSGVPLLHNYPAILRQWGAPGVLRRIRGTRTEPTDAELKLEYAYQTFAALRPDAAQAVVMSDRDVIQLTFYVISGSPRGRTATYEILDSVAATVPNFRTFIVSGADHGLFVANSFYAYAADDVKLVDWLRELVAGRAVQSHRCDGCR